MAVSYVAFGSSQGNVFTYGFVFNVDGDIDRILDSNAAAFIDTWVTPAPPSKSYWIRFSGFTPDGRYTGDTVNTWFALSSFRTCTFSIGPNQTFNESVTCEIASDAAGANVRDTTTLNFNVDSGA
jgi:hypothetical protein